MSYLEGVTWGLCCASYQSLLKRIYDCDIQSAVLALVPMEEEDVSWFPTLAWQQCSTLPRGTQACR